MGNETYVDFRVRINLSRAKLTLKSVSYCDNETVDGVEFSSFPESLDFRYGEDERLVVADMSSNFLSRQVPISKYAVIFGGAQKNIGKSSHSSYPPSRVNCAIPSYSFRLASPALVSRPDLPT